MNVIKKEQLVAGLRDLGLKQGDLLNIKVSLRSIGRIENGPNTLIEALLEVVGPDGTLISDAFVNAYPLPLDKENAANIVTDKTRSYAGAIANAMVQWPGSWRSPHPIQKFVGIGRLAKTLTQAHTENSIAYSLLGQMADFGGKNLKIGSDEKVPGVGTTHVAIERLGIGRKIEPQGVLFYDANSEVKLFKRNWAGGCVDAWRKFYPEYERIGAVIGRGQVGGSPALLTCMKKTLEWEFEMIKADPRVLLCGNKSCRVCQLEWEFSQGSFLHWYIASFPRFWKFRLCRLIPIRLRGLLINHFLDRNKSKL